VKQQLHEVTSDFVKYLTVTFTTQLALTNVWPHENKQKRETNNIIQPCQKTVGHSLGNWICTFTRKFIEQRRTALDTNGRNDVTSIYVT